MSTIQETVAATLRERGIGHVTTGQYSTYIDAVTGSLVERERQIAEALIAKAESFDISTEEARDALESVGLSLPPVAVEADPVTGGGDDVSSLREEVAALRRLVEEGLRALRGRI